MSAAAGSRPAWRAAPPTGPALPPAGGAAPPAGRAAPPAGRARPRAGRLAVVAAVPLAVAGCAADAPAPAPAPPEVSAPAVSGAWAALAARAAAAEDRRFTALYRLSAADLPDRTVVVTSATDGSWRVDIPAGALGGTADVAVARTTAGLFQCSLPSEQRPEEASCVRVDDPDGRLANGVDPQVHHPFTDWVDVLTDRQAPLSVSTAEALPGVPGSCFAVESISASLKPPLDPGIYCYADDGMLTGARLSFGTLSLRSEPAAAPASISLPGPVVDREPLGMRAPPPSPTPSPSVSPAVSAPTG